MQIALSRGGVELPFRGRMALSVKVRLAAEILFAYVRVHLLLRRSNVAETVKHLRNGETDPRPSAPSDLFTATRLGRAVHRFLGHMPYDSQCLVRSLVLTLLLERRGIPSRIVIGVRPGQRFMAHAWVEAGGVPMLPPGDAGKPFERVADL